MTHNKRSAQVKSIILGHTTTTAIPNEIVFTQAFRNAVQAVSEVLFLLGKGYALQ